MFAGSVAFFGLDLRLETFSKGGNAFDRIDQSLEAARTSQEVWGDDGMLLGWWIVRIHRP